MTKETLGQKQRRFTRCLVQLINYIHYMEHDVTLGDAYRDPRVFGKQGELKGYGRASSAHKNRLAVDLNLFKNDKWLTTTAAHAQFGAYWKTLFDDCKWGGDFASQDANHYSIEHQGVC